MATDVRSLLDRVCEMVRARVDKDRLADAKRRQAAALAMRPGDYLPIVPVREVPEAKALPAFDWAEQFHDPATSLYMQLRDAVLPALAGGGDVVPAVRADMGVINCMTVFGAAYDVPAHTRPAITQYVPKENLAEFEVPADISPLGTMPRVIEHMQHHRSALQACGLWDFVRLVHCDQQGPWDIAAQARGHDLFVDLYDDPEFVHALMAKCAAVYVAVSKLCKTFDPSPVGGCAGNAFWMENGSVRMCGDSDILISAAQHREFATPYEQQALEAMGGGWLHYCGGMPGFRRREGLHLHEIYAGNTGLRGLNWTTAGDWEGEMRRLYALGLCNIGMLPRGPGEPLADYFCRALGPYPERKGLIFDNPDIRPDEVDIAVDLWRKVQDEKYK